MNHTHFRIGGVPEHFNLPWRLAIESGAFEKEGINLDYQVFPGGTGGMTRALREEKLDIAILLTEGIVADILKGNPSKIIKVYVESPLIWGIHVAANSDLYKVNEMRGKTYAISRFGSGSHLMAIVDAVQRGWSPQEMNFELIKNLAGARKALPAGKAAIFFWERFMTQPYVDSGEFRRISELLTPWPCFMIAARDEVIEKHPEKLVALCNVINQAVKDLLARPDRAELIASRYDLQVSQVEEWLSRTEWNTNRELPLTAFDRVLEGLIGAEILPKDEYTYDQFLVNLG